MKLFLKLVRDAISELYLHKLRTLLTLLGMIFGVGSVIAMLNIGEGAEREALRVISSLGAQNLIVENKSVDKARLHEVREESMGLTMADVKASLATLSFVEDYSVAKFADTYTIRSNLNTSDAEVLGVTETWFQHANMTLSQGRFLNTSDEINMSQVAVLGANAAEELFPEVDAIGQVIKINHLWVSVIGVLQIPESAQTEFQGVQVGGARYQIFLPLSTVQNKLKQERLTSELDVVKLGINENTDPRVASLAVRQLMELRHGKAEDYNLIVPAELLEQQSKTQRIFNIVMACIAGISLLVGGIGIMNIMLATVLERTREIGLLRAIGATQRDIKLQFLAESFTISVMGGIVGVVFGLILSELIGFYSGWAVSWSLLAVTLSLAICISIGVGFGVFPATKASKLNPIDALHSD